MKHFIEAKNNRYTFRAASQWLLILLALLCVVSGKGQSEGQTRKGWSIETNLHLGQIIKHSPKLLFDVKGLTSAAEIYINRQSYGKKEWEQFQRFPKLGVSFFYHDLGAADVFGEALTVMPNISIAAIRKEHIKFDFRFGTGLSYLTKKYNVITNPSFNAIGSHWNASVLFEFYGRWKLSEKWQFKGGLNLLHYSNGGSHLPNFGINVASLMVGVTYTPQPILASHYIRHELPKKRSNKRWGALAWATLAYTERGVSGGPSQPVYGVSIATFYYLNKVNRLVAGMEYEYNKSVYEFGKHVYAFDSEAEAKRRSSRRQIFIADEFLFGNWGITVLLGAYTNDSFYLIPFPVYNKLMTRYYFQVSGRLKIHVGVYLKSHISIAEYLGFGTGFSF